MSGEEGTRQRRPVDDEKEEEGSNNNSTNENRNSDEEKEGSSRALPNLYHRFVDSFERALGQVASASKECTNTGRLKNLNLEGVADYIKSGKARNVIVMTGAGVSTAAGIPDFRSAGTGLYDNLQEYDLSNPMDLFTISFFDEQPEPFYLVAKKLFPEEIKPTRTHHFVHLLHKKGLLRRWYTQNIDSLEYETGIPDDKVVTAHGNHRTSTCRKCFYKYDLAWMTEKLRDPSIIVPKCDKCSGVVKPDITFFGENLPKRFFQSAISDFPKCDLLIIMGTSLAVQPFAGMIHEVSDETPRLLINMEDVGNVSPSEHDMGVPGLCYGHKKNDRDIFWKGTCDEGVQRLAELLDWEHELESLQHVASI